MTNLMSEFLENRFHLDLEVKQSGEKIGDVGLPPWANDSTREFIKKHREALELDYVGQHYVGQRMRKEPVQETNFLIW
ncbi:hypothetical protein L2E82_08760 [Cichorium intybus]|uniref:Uncharacterized protein n=1 Tax=Cichorium intybus TaxID=13427 RepID=A0ACB9G7I6_CICIN|nr:hypothetical protein L2E82_08760 [Cichorium intybus]